MSTPVNGGASNVDANHFWDEYQYRHEHIWKTIFSLSGACVLLSLIPYTQQKVACQLGNWILLAPVLAIALYAFGAARLKREFELFNLIKERHRQLQEMHWQIPHAERGRSFYLHAKLYLAGLGLVLLINIAILIWLWLPAVTVVDCFAVW